MYKCDYLKIALSQNGVKNLILSVINKEWNVRNDAWVLGEACTIIHDIALLYDLKIGKVWTITLSTLSSINCKVSSFGIFI